MDIDWIKQAVKHNNYRYSRHADQERQNDNLSLVDIAQALLNGRILSSIMTRDTIGVV
ncbi:MAG: hypothetical protein WAX77_14645 [Methylococcaceae bacterium]